MAYIPLTALAHESIKTILKSGDVCIDATMGNGQDTLLLAQAVGSSGHVYAFDIQSQALTMTRQRLTHTQLQSRVTLIKADHQSMADYVSHPVRAIMFNLGYLPGGNKTIITHTASTLKALNAAIKLLTTPGCLTIIAYPGHPGGNHETLAIKNWISHLPDKRFQIKTIIPQNKHRPAPELIIIHQQN